MQWQYFLLPSQTLEENKNECRGGSILPADLNSLGLLCKLVKYLKSATAANSFPPPALAAEKAADLKKKQKKNHKMFVYNLWNPIENKNHLLLKTSIFQSSPSSLPGQFHSEIASS